MKFRINHSTALILGFTIIFLFLVQSAGVLVESIYILDLMNTQLDEKAAGILFFFAPVLLLFFGKKENRWYIWILTILLVLARGVFPYFHTLERMLASGLALAAAFLLVMIWFSKLLTNQSLNIWRIPAQALALAVALSTLLRTLNGTLDLSLVAGSAWLGWILGLALIIITALLPLEKNLNEKPAPGTGQRMSLAAPVGLVSIIVLVHFAFFSPGVIARWAQGSYPTIVSLVGGLSLLWVFFALWKPDLLEKISSSVIFAWNLLFTLSLSGLILSHTPVFPASPGAAPVVVGTPSSLQQSLLIITLLLFPVIFLDFNIFSRTIVRHQPGPAQLAPGFLLGTLYWVILIFMNIFTNVWGYVKPISPFFRGKYWLPFLLIGGTATLLAWCLSLRNHSRKLSPDGVKREKWLLPMVILGSIFGLIWVTALLTERPQPASQNIDTLTVMTYNIQQANDHNGEKSYQQQMALIRQVNPDILALQESDSARISLGNNDYVRYYASQLDYYEYYGPTTTAGTFGTALLSKYPLENPQVFFTYSDADEVGTTQAEIMIDGFRFAIFCVHPAGSDLVDQAFATALLDRASDHENVIILGDFNLRESESAYQQVAAVFKNAWISVYPTGISDQGLDLSGDKRIDHIFVSPHLEVLEAYYILSPESATDHPVHWVKLTWK